MIAGVFYPTLTVYQHVLYEKIQIFWELCTHAFTRVSPWTPWEAYSTPQTPSCNLFWLRQKPMRPYFFCIISWTLMKQPDIQPRNMSLKKGKTIDKQDNIHINRAKEKVQKSKQMNTDTTKHIAPKTQSKNRSEENIKSNMLTT